MRHVGQILDVWRGSSSRKAAKSRRGERRCSGRVANWLAAEATTLPADATKGNWSNACSAASSSLLHSAFWVAVMPALHLILQQPLPLCLIDRRPTPATTLRQPCGTRFNCCILLLRCLLLLLLQLLLLPGLCQAAASGTKPIELKLCARACKKRDGVDRLMPPTTAASTNRPAFALLRLQPSPHPSPHPRPRPCPLPHPSRRPRPPLHYSNARVCLCGIYQSRSRRLHH